MSQYHVLPRDSIESDRESHEYLIPSPRSAILDASPRPGKSCSMEFNGRIILRLISSTLSFVALMILFIRAPYPFLPAAIFLAITLGHNLIQILHHFVSPILRVSLHYRERDVFAAMSGQSTFRKPGLASYVDLMLNAGLIITLAVGWTGWSWYWTTEGAIAGSVFGWVVVALQLIVAIPTLDRVGFTVSSSVARKNRVALGRDFVHRPDTKDDSFMRGAGAEVREATAIPPQETSTVPGNTV